MKLRTGGHDNRLVYLQDLDEPTKQDPMVAVYLSADQATMVVDQINNAVWGAWWWERFAAAGE